MSNINPQDFQKSTAKRAETMALISFILSILSFLLILLSEGESAFGIFVYILIYVLAASGLKTKRRGLAIAAIVITSASLLFLIVKIIQALD